MPNYTSAFTIKIVALVNLGRDHEAHETYLRYAMLPEDIQTRSSKRRLCSIVSPPRKFGMVPKFVAEQQRWFDSLHKAGMPDE